MVRGVFRSEAVARQEAAVRLAVVRSEGEARLMAREAVEEKMMALVAPELTAGKAAAKGDENLTFAMEGKASGMVKQMAVDGDLWSSQSTMGELRLGRSRGRCGSLEENPRRTRAYGVGKTG